MDEALVPESLQLIPLELHTQVLQQVYNATAQTKLAQLKNYVEERFNL
jgi:hypothetical protein